MAAPAGTHKFVLISSLYISQALPLGFFQQALPLILRREGFALEQVTLAKLVLLPWALKWLWAPYLDRLNQGAWGARRSWLLPLQMLATLLTLLLAYMDVIHAPASVMLVILLLNLVCATQDIATDALAVKLLQYNERGPGNGIQAAGYQAGLVLGGGVMLLLYVYVQWTGILLAMATMMALPLLPILFMREAAEPRQVHTRYWHSLRSFFAQPGSRLWVAILVVYVLGNSWAMAVFRPQLVDAGLSDETIGWMLGIWGIVASIAGAATGGILLRYLHRALMLRTAALCMLICLTAYLLPAHGPGQLHIFYFICLLNKFAGGVGSAVLFTWMMDRCRSTHAGSDFTLQQSIFNLATITAAFSGLVAGAWHYQAVYGIALGMAALALLLSYRTQAAHTAANQSA